MASIPVIVLAGQSNADFSGPDNRMFERLIASGNAFELIKVAEGGTSLFPTPVSDWDPASTNELFAELVDAIRAGIANVTAQGHVPDVRLLWAQGEADTGRSVQAYEAALGSFLTTLRQAIGVPDMPIHVVLLPFQSTVRTAQLHVDADLAGVTTIDLAPAGYWDGVHYDKPTRERMADAFIASSGVVAAQVDGYQSLRTAAQVSAVNGITTVTGPAFEDYRYVGDDSHTVLRSYHGDDVIRTGAGNDQIFTDGNDDVVFSGAGNDYVDGGPHDDYIDGGPGNDFLQGRQGTDILLGGAGNDLIAAGDQNDRVDGGPGDDIIQGGHGDDYIDGGDGSDTHTYDGAPGRVEVSLASSGPQNTIGSGVDTLVGIENLTGSAFADVLNGNAGSNVLRGFLGPDTLSGGGGADIFSGNLGEFAGDRITDFGSDDALHIIDGALTMSVVRAGPILTFGNGTKLTLDNAPSGAVTLAPNPLGGVTLTIRPSQGTSVRDFDGSGTSDILWRNADGALTTWQIAPGYDIRPNAYATRVDPTYKVVATFDFNGDSRSDLMWRRGGDFTIWTASGNGFAQNSFVNATVSSDWTVAATGDFNADGLGDILWRNRDGTLTEWQSTGAGFVQNSFVTRVDTSWKVIGAGDFNGDGADDMLWRNAQTGEFTIWQSTGGGFAQNSYFDPSVALSYHIAGIGDFNGDRKDDLLWRNDAGIFTIWTSNGAGFTKNAYVDTTVGPEWTLASFSDMSGDGKADLLWRNAAASSFTIWQSTGTGFGANVFANSSVGSGWTPAGDGLFYL